MTYNLHPIFVHFPIALLFLYSIIKILPMQRWLPQYSWKDIRLVILTIGVLGAFAALSTGETAEHLTRPNHQLVEAHSTFAALSTWLYGALLVGELAIELHARFASALERLPTLQKLVFVLNRTLGNKAIASILAIIALLSITTTGLLGGTLVYGTTADPLAGFVLKLLGITL